MGASGNANLIMSSSQVTGNTTQTAGGDDATGGGLLVNGNATLHNVTITGNVAAGDGGGIFADSNALTIDQTSIISNNTAGGNGGGLWFSSVSGEPASLSEVTMTGQLRGQRRRRLYRQLATGGVHDALRPPGEQYSDAI